MNKTVNDYYNLPVSSSSKVISPTKLQNCSSRLERTRLNDRKALLKVIFSMITA